MKLSDISLPIKKQASTGSLIKHLKNITLLELNYIINYYDNKENLVKTASGWNCLHYAVLNSDPKIVETIIQLYKKHNISLSLEITKDLNEMNIGSNAMDIAYKKDIWHSFLLLHKEGEQANFIMRKNVNLIDKFKNNGWYNKGEDQELFISYENNPFTPLLFCRGNKNIFKFLLSNEYEEKDKYIQETIHNIKLLYQKHEKTNYLTDQIISLFQSLYENESKNNQSDKKNLLAGEQLEFLFCSFIEILKKDNFDYEGKDEVQRMIVCFQNIENVLFFHHKTIPFFMEVKNIIGEREIRGENHKIFDKVKNYIGQFQPQITHYILENRLEEKPTIKKINKI